MNSTSRAFGRWPACAGLNAFRVGEGRHLARSASEDRFQSGPSADAGRGGASNEFDLERPSADGRPAPAEKPFRVGTGRRGVRSAWWGRFPIGARGRGIFVPAKADTWREAPHEADFQSA